MWDIKIERKTNLCRIWPTIWMTKCNIIALTLQSQSQVLNVKWVPFRIDLEKWNVAPEDWAIDFNLFFFVIWDELKSMIMHITRRAKSILFSFQQLAMINLKLYWCFYTAVASNGALMVLLAIGGGRAGKALCFSKRKKEASTQHGMIFCAHQWIPSTGLVSHLWMLLQVLMYTCCSRTPSFCRVLY